VLRLVLPKGSLEKPTLELFEAADLRVVRSSTVDYKASIDDPRIDEVRILRPQEIPTYVAEGLFDLGIAGRDWVEETASDVTILGELQYSKASNQPFRIVLAVPGDSPYAGVGDLPQGVRVSSEYPELTRQFFEKHGIQADIRLSYGATEAKVPDIVDCIVDGTETGRALRAAGLEARGKVLVKLNVGRDDLDRVIQLLPSMKSPTVSELFGEGGYAVETVVAKDTINTLIPALKDVGASDIIELPLAKIVH
jgi:ATP phosphoribosyltransferase